MYTENQFEVFFKAKHTKNYIISTIFIIREYDLQACSENENCDVLYKLASRPGNPCFAM